MYMNKWKKCKLGDALNFRRGHDLPKSSMIEGEVPVAGSNGVIGYHNVSTPISPCITIGRSGNVGTPYIYDKCWAHNTVLYIDDYKGNHPRYLYYLLKNLPLASFGGGSAVPTLNRNHIHPIEISLPPLAEQKRIADILSAIDDKIELNRRINANLEQQAQALYKSWFVDNKKDDWEEGVASDYFNITIGKTPPRKETKWFSTSNKDHVWISISDMGKHGMYLGQSSEYLTQSAIEKFNIVIVPDKTVLLSFKLTIGRVVISDGNVTTNEAIAHFNTNDQNLLEYTYLSLKNYEFSALGSTSSIATAVNSKTIKSMRWIMPNHNLIKQFHEKVGPLFNMIRQNEKEINNLSTLRDTLLPKLMSGEIKV